MVVFDSFSFLFSESENMSLIFYDSFCFVVAIKKPKRNSLPSEHFSLLMLQFISKRRERRWIPLCAFHVLVHRRALAFLLDLTPIVRYFFSFSYNRFLHEVEITSIKHWMRKLTQLALGRDCFIKTAVVLNRTCVKGVVLLQQLHLPQLHLKA